MKLINEEAKMEYLVTVHGDTDVVTAFPRHQQAQAIELWQRYVAEGKFATLTVD
ncbi:hypothetical protein [Pseudomonas sp. PS02302]|uniref:hypothetical protein n=1 Tax=Pseudomonas sp. PS02302 TaxID=2991428 RepID=UPI00249C3B06|nr:hypothetical protein [Pseudomonas sp. PS02302]